MENQEFDETAGNLDTIQETVLMSSATTPPSKTRTQVSYTQAAESALDNLSLETVHRWQCTKKTVCERNAAMLFNELMSDICFIVGPKGAMIRIPAHKYILATGSSVFFAMLYGDMAESKDEIHIPDVEPTAFKILLRYLYCDKIDLEADTVLPTLYAAKKYIIPHLASACVSFLETSLSSKNACLLLSQSWLFEEEKLTQKCWEVIDSQAALSLQADGFTDIELRTLNSILERDSLNAKESVIFDAVMRWSEAECKRKDISPNMENRRTVLGDSLYQLRFPAMTLQEFADGPARSGLLTQQETIDLFLWFSSTKKPTLLFPPKQRRSNQWRYRGRCDSIQFMSDKRIFLAGLGLYGSSSGVAKYTADTKLTKGQETLAEEKISFLSDGMTKIFPVWFKHPVQCEPHVFHTASVILDGNELSYFGQEGLSEVTCGDVVIHFQCSNESTNGTGIQGGQIPELIFYRGSA